MNESDYMGRIIEYYELKEKYRKGVSFGPGAKFIYIIGVTFTITDDDRYITWEAHLTEWTDKDNSLLFRAGVADDLIEAIIAKTETLKEILTMLGLKYSRSVFHTVTEIENTL